MHREGGDQDKRGPLHEFLRPPAPFRHFLMSEGRLIKERTANLVTYVPRIELADPLIHLCLGNLFRVVDQSCEDARLMIAALPESKRERVLSTVRFGQLTELRQ